MADPSSTIENAFERLQHSISTEDAHDFASTELKDVWKLVREIDVEQRKRQSAQNLRRIEPLLKGIEKYAKVVEVLCNGTPFLPYIWAPIKLMLQLASQHRDIFEHLLQAYAEIGAALPRFDRYEKAFKENLEFQSILAAVYSTILEFHRKTYKFFQRRAWRLLFASLWKDFGGRFSGIIEDLKRHRDFIDREAASIDIVESKSSRSLHQTEIEQRQKQSLMVIEQAEKEARISRGQHAVAWLSVDIRDQDEHYERISRRRHNDTCKWIRQQASMESWIKNDSKVTLLWLNGKPGAGKSVMCSYIIELLLDSPNIDTLYYFCSSQDGDNVCIQVLKTLALQLLRQNQDVASLIANEFVYKARNCGLRELRTLVPQLLAISSNTRIVFDGIDECSKRGQKDILKELQDLCLGQDSHCKIIISSRKEPDLVRRLSSKPQIALDGHDKVTSDIEQYVKHKIRKLKTSNPILLSSIELLLVDKADGMFLWVRLVVKELRHCYSDQELEESSNRLPKGLDEAYGRILDRIMKGSPIAIRVLEWMACSRRPLKVYEILDGIAFRPGSTSLTTHTKVHKEVLDLCRPLVEDGPSDTVDFVHFSAKRYILEGNIPEVQPFINLEVAHFNIIFSCVAYLNTSHRLLPFQSGSEERAMDVVYGFHGLQLYANKFWIEHLLSYCTILTQQQKQLPPELLHELSRLLRFIKEPLSAMQITNESSSEMLKVLDQHPEIKRLVVELQQFRVEQSKVDLYKSGKTIFEMNLAFCSSDPTNFSAVHQYYQTTVEELLDQRASEMFPSIEQEILRGFSKTYGNSAYVCRYMHCVRTTQGFASSRNRDNHEAVHERKFRCAYVSCSSFSMGFATKSALKKHNERYHVSISSQSSLSDTISRALTRPRSSTPEPSTVLVTIEPEESALKIVTKEGSENNMLADGDTDKDIENNMSNDRGQDETAMEKSPDTIFSLRSLRLTLPATRLVITEQDLEAFLARAERKEKRFKSQEKKFVDLSMLQDAGRPLNPDVTVEHRETIAVAIRLQMIAGLRGWRADVATTQRINLISDLIQALFFATEYSSHHISLDRTNRPPYMRRFMDIIIAYERDLFKNSLDKDEYEDAIEWKLKKINEYRERMASKAAAQQPPTPEVGS